MLSQFYKELQAWIDAGFPKHRIFMRSQALCYTLTLWQELNGHEVSTIKLIQQFHSAGLDNVYPFNPEKDFWKENDNQTVYENKARLQWVKDHAK